MKLVIGSRTSLEGWKTFDIVPGPEVDFIGDCRDLSQFADGSIEAIYASHVLEHVMRGEIQKTIREWYRALRPDAAVMISVPDFELLCRMFLHPQMNFDQRYTIMRIIFGGQMDPHDLHYAGLTMEFLTHFLSEAGFVEIARVRDFGLMPDTSVMEFGGVPISLNVQARKPAA